MVGLTSASDYASRLKDAIKESNWEALESSLDRLKQIFFEAVVFGHRDVATLIGKAIAEARHELVLKERIRPIRTAESASWLLASDNATCLIGLRMFRPESSSEAPVEETVEQSILANLYESPDPLNTGEIAGLVGCARETASRALTALRDKSFVRTVPVGRSRVHYITRRGQLRLMGTQGGQIRPSEDPLSKPDTPKDLINRIPIESKWTFSWNAPPKGVRRELLVNSHHPTAELEQSYAFNPEAECRVLSTPDKLPAAAAYFGGVK